MVLRAAAFFLTVPLFFVEAQTAPVDCSRRTAEDYVAITRTERAANYVRSLTGPHAYLYAAVLSGYDQLRDHPKEWGEGSLGYGRRFGNDFATHIVTTSLQNGLALGLGEDDRYFSSGERGFGHRLAYALTSPLLARRSDGSRTIALSALGGAAGGALVQQVWQPRSTSHMSNAARSFGLTFAFRAGLDFAREFAPRAFGAFFR
jgi:hypothetical protein